MMAQVASTSGSRSELESTLATSVAPSQLSVPTPGDIPVPSFQDIDSEMDSSDEEQDWEAIVAAAEAAFSEEEIEEMQYFLKERGLFAFVKHYVDVEAIPIPKLLLAFGVAVPPHLASHADHLRLLKIACSRVLRNRDKLPEYNTVDDAVELIRKSKNILILTGAGVSTSCGIPDFRSPTGLYARLKEEHWELEDPQEMFDLTYFKDKPNVFYSFAKEIYPSNFIPSPCHRFVKVLENNDRLLRNYTQNIDGLFESVGVHRMLNCHGSFVTASCLRCHTTFPGSAIEADVYAQRVPLCPLCTVADEAKAAALAALPEKKMPQKWNSRDVEDDTDDDEGVKGEWEGKPLVKPDIVFFGEMLSDEFDRRLLEDREKVDLLIVIGTSLRVSPVSQIVSHLPHSVPQIVINRDPITHANFDIHLLGDGDTIVRYLCDQLGESFNLSQVKVAHDPPSTQLPIPAAPVTPERVGISPVWLFPGANGGSWVEAVRRAYAESDDEGEEDGELSQGLESLQVPPGSRSRSRSRSAEGEEVEGERKKARVA